MFAVVVNNTLDRTERESVHYDGVLGAVRAIAWSSKLCSGLGLLKPSQLIKTNPFTVPILTAAHKQRAVDKTMYTIWLQRQEGGDCEQSKAFLPVVSDVATHASVFYGLRWTAPAERYRFKLSLTPNA